MDCRPSGSSVHGILQGIFLTQWSDSCLLHCRQIDTTFIAEPPGKLCMCHWAFAKAEVKGSMRQLILELMVEVTSTYQCAQRIPVVVFWGKCFLKWVSGKTWTTICSKIILLVLKFTLCSWARSLGIFCFTFFLLKMPKYPVTFTHMYVRECDGNFRTR